MAPQAGIGAAPCGIYTLFYQPEGLPVPPGGRAADEGGGYCGGLLPTAQLKCPEEIWRIRAASKALKAGMDAALSVVRAGISERDVLVEAEYAMGKAGSQGSPFRMQVLTHSRQMQKHPYAGAALLEDNAPVVIHLGASVEATPQNVPYGLSGYAAGGMCGDLPGAPEGSGNRSRQTAPRRDLRSALSGCCDCVEKAGYGEHWVMEHIGYGVGIRQSEFYPIIAKGSAVPIEKKHGG